MMGLGMTELLCFAVIALLVLGPDKLPVALRAAAKWYVRIKSMISNIQTDIEKQLRLSELKAQMEEELKKIEALEKKMQAQFDELEKQKPLRAEEKQLVERDGNNKILTYRRIHSTEELHLPFSKKIRSLLSSKASSVEQMQSDTPQAIQLKIAV